ncbi:Uncharacterised protein [Yersinia intermedia]|nr:Uncharacterised protein [Yersinia intermedia]CNB46814.1 Uncharacterised protein [Yersinia intermedia]CNF88945.1 Uncharacterised protein [Yersinia intermedia]CRE46851.1 Uncharacterised protein [Yersinia intermedia]
MIIQMDREVPIPTTCGEAEIKVMGVSPDKEALMVAGLPILSMMAVIQYLLCSRILLSRQKLLVPVGSFIVQKPAKKAVVRVTIICV